MELEFPLDFKCPHCGSDERVLQNVVDKDKAEGQLGEHIITGTIRNAHTPITDPQKPPRPGQEALVMGIYYDLCAHCGQEYIFRVTHEISRFSLDVSKLIHKPPPSIPPGLIHSN